MAHNNKKDNKQGFLRSDVNIKITILLIGCDRARSLGADSSGSYDFVQKDVARCFFLWFFPGGFFFIVSPEGSPSNPFLIWHPKLMSGGIYILIVSLIIFILLG